MSRKGKRTSQAEDTAQAEIRRLEHLREQMDNQYLKPQIRTKSIYLK